MRLRNPYGAFCMARGYFVVVMMSGEEKQMGAPVFHLLFGGFGGVGGTGRWLNRTFARKGDRRDVYPTVRVDA